MVRYVGNAEVPGICLKYFVFGNRRHGYSIRILNSDGVCAHHFISPKLTKTLDLADKLRRCVVFPENLLEILEDMQILDTEAGDL